MLHLLELLDWEIKGSSELWSEVLGGLLLFFLLAQLTKEKNSGIFSVLDEKNLNHDIFTSHRDIV